MRNILVIGAGRSSTILIEYLLDAAKKYGWFVTVADAKPELAAKKVNGHPNGRGTWLDVLKPNDRKDLMARNDLVVSLLPPHLHYRIAKDCIKYKKQLVTASYVSRDLYRLEEQVMDASLIFMGEMGYDPGVDNMSLVKYIHQIKDKKGKLTSVRSYSGDLIAPEYDDNPWHYKITWNPRNLVINGQGTSQYVVKNKYKNIPYNRLFKQYRLVDIPDIGQFESYASRDSLMYRKAYGLDKVPTLKRAILRQPGFCDAWDALVQLGLTDDSYPILESKKLTYRELTDSYLVDNPYNTGTIKERLAAFLGIGASSEIIKKLEWLGLFDRRMINLEKATPAKILEDLLVKKWTPSPEDKDWLIMHHVYKYKIKNKLFRLKSTMTLQGENAERTAISKVIGLPIGIFVKMIMNGQIKKRGFEVAIQPEVYNPVLDELKDHGIVFTEEEEAI